MDFFRAFGVSWQSVIAELINFAVLLTILYFIGYKPILEFVKKRQNIISEGVDNAEKAKQALIIAREEKEKLLSEARKEGLLIIDGARKKAQEQQQAMLDKAKLEVAGVVKQGKVAIEAQKQKMLEEVKGDVIDMVISSTKKVLGSAVDKSVDQNWLKTQLSKAKK